MQMLAISIGIVEPRRAPEMWGYLVSILLGAVLYAIFVAVLTAVVADLDTSARAYRSRLDMVNQYMHHSQLPRELRAKLRTYYHLVFPSKRSFDEESILAEVSRPLKQEVCLHKCRSVLAALQLLDDGKSEKGLPGAISQRLERVVFVTGDYIIREGEETEGLFFVSSGLVELFTSANVDNVLTTLGAGSMFGEMALLSQSGRAVASVRVKTFCEGYHLSKTSFNAVISTYPSFKEYLESVARLRLQKNAKKGGVAGPAAQDLQGMLEDAMTTGQTKQSLRKQSMIMQGKHMHRHTNQAIGRLVKKLNVASRDESNAYATERKSFGYDACDSMYGSRGSSGGSGSFGKRSSSRGGGAGDGQPRLMPRTNHQRVSGKNARASAEVVMQEAGESAANKDDEEESSFSQTPEGSLPGLRPLEA